MATLYTLTDAYAELLARLEVAESEAEADAIWQEMDALEGDIAEKAEAYARILKNKQAEALAFKAEKDRLAGCQKAAENVAERLKARLLDTMQRMDVTAIPTSIGKWSRQLNPYSAQIVDAEAVPERFRIPQPDKIDTRAIIDEHKRTGEIFPGVEVTRKEGVRFR